MGEETKKAWTCGFTLIELLIVISIMGILLGIVIFNNRSMQTYSDDGERRDDVTSIARRLEQAYVNQDVGSPSYPSTTELVTDAASRTRTMKDINAESLMAPGSDSPSIFGATTTSQTSPLTGMTPNQYVYQPFKKDGSLCTDSASNTPANRNCVRFTIYYMTALTPSLQSVTSMHRQ